jgi:hypothetical protein
VDETGKQTSKKQLMFHKLLTNAFLLSYKNDIVS